VIDLNEKSERIARFTEAVLAACLAGAEDDPPTYARAAKRFATRGGWRAYAACVVAALIAGHASERAPGLDAACWAMGIPRGTAGDWLRGGPLPGERVDGDCVAIDEWFRSATEQRAMSVRRGRLEALRRERRAIVREATRAIDREIRRLTRR
jgi:hypothetical protein